MALMQQFGTTSTSSTSTQASLESSAIVGNNSPGEEHSIIKDGLDNNNKLAQEGILPDPISLHHMYVRQMMESSQYDAFNL